MPERMNSRQENLPGGSLLRLSVYIILYDLPVEPGVRVKGAGTEEAGDG